VSSNSTFDALKRHSPAQATQALSCNHKTATRYPPPSNALNQDFSITTANAKWVSDFTHIDTTEGWLYFEIILDWFSRKVESWVMFEQMNTTLVETPL
jgi:transposase InsO family protein